MTTRGRINYLNLSRDALTFTEWMAHVDKRLWVRTGTESADLPDCDYRAWYDAGISAWHAAQRALRNAGYREQTTELL